MKSKKRKCQIKKDIISSSKPALTKREWFAGMALQGLLSIYGINNHYTTDISSTCLTIADEMIAKLEK